MRPPSGPPAAKSKYDQVLPSVTVDGRRSSLYAKQLSLGGMGVVYQNLGYLVDPHSAGSYLLRHRCLTRSSYKYPVLLFLGI